jgi:predicted metal-dependent hydrolase
MPALPPEHQPNFEKGIDEFNRREFYDCHETLEKVWQEYREDDRELIQGIIQIAVGYYHLLRDNSVGALKLLRRGLWRVEKFAPIYFDLDLTPFIANVSEDITSTEKNEHPPAIALRIPRIGFISSSPDC